MRPSAEERIYLDVRRHGAVLLRPLLRAFAVAAAGILLLALPWPVPVVAPIVLGLAAVLALSAVWSWDRTRFVVTTEKAFLLHGTVKRRAAAVRLSRVSSVEIEQSLIGRLLGYGTVVAGGLRVDYVPRPHDVVDLLG
jgi:uncharacterized membrane protein YdbT with pleckstrin-like domain